jgi:hypothetical protein
VTRRLWEWLDTKRARNVALIALAVMAVLGFFLVSPSYLARML